MISAATLLGGLTEGIEKTLIFIVQVERLKDNVDLSLSECGCLCRLISSKNASSVSKKAPLVLA